MECEILYNDIFPERAKWIDCEVKKLIPKIHPRSIPLLYTYILHLCHVKRIGVSAEIRKIYNIQVWGDCRRTKISLEIYFANYKPLIDVFRGSLSTDDIFIQQNLPTLIKKWNKTMKSELSGKLTTHNFVFSILKYPHLIGDIENYKFFPGKCEYSDFIHLMSSKKISEQHIKQFMHHFIPMPNFDETEKYYEAAKKYKCKCAIEYFGEKYIHHIERRKQKIREEIDALLK